MRLFHGVVVPMLTPFQSNGRIDEAAAVRYVRYLVDNGVHGLFTLSSTGEFCAMQWETQVRYVEVVLRAAAGRVPVCAGVSSQCLAECKDKSAQLADAGVNAVVALPPFYFRTSQDEMIRFFSAIADTSPVPLLMYNMPFRTQHNIEPETVEVLSRHPNICGLKDSVTDADRTNRLSARFRDNPDFSYLHGNELLMLEAGYGGAHGCVPSLANLDPAFLSQAWNAAAMGDRERGPADEARIGALMRGFSLFETVPQSSTTLRLMALKAVLAELGIMEANMAQLAPPLTREWRRFAGEFVAEHGLSSSQVQER